MKKIFLILISLFIFVVSISCISATSLDVDDVVASEGPALLGNGFNGSLGSGLGSSNPNVDVVASEGPALLGGGIHGGFSGGIGSNNPNVDVVASEGPALLGSGVHGGFSGGIGSINLNTGVNPEVPLQ